MARTDRPLAEFWVPGGVPASRFDEFYPNPPPRPVHRDQLDEYRGRRVTWLGEPGRMLRVTPAMTSPREDNVFDAEKLAAVAAAVRSGRRIVSYAPYAHLMVVDRELVQGTQEAHARDRLALEYGTARPFTTGAEDLDRWLADPDRAEGRARPLDPARWRRGMEARVRRREASGRGDFGRLWVRVRDGNHRLFGAFLGGEPWAWVTVPEEYLSYFSAGDLR